MYRTPTGGTVFLTTYTLVLRASDRFFEASARLSEPSDRLSDSQSPKSGSQRSKGTFTLHVHRANRLCSVNTPSDKLSEASERLSEALDALQSLYMLSNEKRKICPV